jgi:hypothetical protein
MQDFCTSGIRPVITEPDRLVLQDVINGEGDYPAVNSTGLEKVMKTKR